MNDEAKTVEMFYKTLMKIIEDREGVKIDYVLERRKDDGLYVQTRES